MYACTMLYTRVRCHQLIEVAKNIWVGDSQDEELIYIKPHLVECVLITAHDMESTSGYDDGVEYMQVGLVDGPGNLLATYHAAVLALVTLTRKGRVLVCDHDGGRSLAVVIMYLYLIGDGPSWDECVERLKARRGPLPFVHSIHKKAFSLMDWGMLHRVLDGEVQD